MNRNLNDILLNYLFVFIQFGGIAFLLFTGPIFANDIRLLMIEIVGIFLAFWAIYSMQLNNLSIYPKLKDDAVFVKHGPYKLIRHSMYLSIIITFIPLIIDKFTYFRLMFLILIFIDLLFKLRYEEGILKNTFPEYSAYMNKTYRLFPYLY
jgi:protein-S-isoprenylcysteine O-methyltransferase Ste14